MGNATTQNDVDAALLRLFFPKLKECEDFDTFEELIAISGRTLLAEAITNSIEAFDRDLRACRPRSWTVHECAKRTLLTLLGEVTYWRTVFIDEFGCHRILADELRGIPKRSRVSVGAFLWVVRHAAELSCRKTALAFADFSGCALSHVTVMNCVKSEGAYLKSAASLPRQKISQDTLFLEVDGLWIHTQEPVRRKEALPRFLYEQARETVTFELKIAPLYAGKRKVGPDRYVRDGLALTCSVDDADDFWKKAFNLIKDNYELDDIERLWLGADGGSWCGPERIMQEMSGKSNAIASLDPFYVMQKIRRAFPEGAASRLGDELGCAQKSYAASAHV